MSERRAEVIAEAITSAAGHVNGEGIRIDATELERILGMTYDAAAPSSKGVSLIASERERQVIEEGYDADHDRGHAEQLIRAGDAYAQRTAMGLSNPFMAPELYGHPADFGAWPWERDSWKPTGDAVRDLTKAGALLAAAIDSILLEQGKDSSDER